jgi:hypothetical protein
MTDDKRTEGDSLARSLAASLGSRLRDLENPKLTRGAIALRTYRLRDVARALGCCTRAVTNWRQARKMPSLEHREALERLFNIPQGAWFLLQNSPNSAAPVDAPPAALAEQLDRVTIALAMPITAEARADLERLRAAIHAAIAHCRASAARASKSSRAEQLGSVRTSHMN